MEVCTIKSITRDESIPTHTPTGTKYKEWARATPRTPVYVHVYTHRSGKWSVNHNTYILVYIEQGSGKQGKCRTVFFILRLGVDTGGEICKTIYN